MALWRNTLWRDASPTGAVKDFAQVWNDNPYRWRTLGLAIAMTGGLLYLAIPKTEYAPPVEPEITYITTLDEGRTRAQILASNIANQKQQDALRAQDQQREEIRKQAWEAIGRATFIDVDSLKKQAAKDEAARKAAAEKIAADNAARFKEQQGAAGK